MTAARAAKAYRPPMEQWRWSGGELVTARITPAGRVLMHLVKVTARQNTLRGDVELWPTVTDATDLGQVDPDDPTAWFHAEVLIRRAGWQPAADWTTVDRMPAVRLRRAPWTSPGTVPGEN